MAQDDDRPENTHQGKRSRRANILLTGGVTGKDTPGGSVPITPSIGHGTKATMGPGRCVRGAAPRSGGVPAAEDDGDGAFRFWPSSAKCIVRTRGGKIPVYGEDVPGLLEVTTILIKIDKGKTPLGRLYGTS